LNGKLIGARLGKDQWRIEYESEGCLVDIIAVRYLERWAASEFLMTVWNT
jgi:hypothetical protein